MKTTLEIPDDLFRKVKAKAALEDRRLTDLVTEALQTCLEQPPSGKGKRLKFPLIKAGDRVLSSIPDDVAAQESLNEDLERHEASLR